MSSAIALNMSHSTIITYDNCFEAMTDLCNSYFKKYPYLSVSLMSGCISSYGSFCFRIQWSPLYTKLEVPNDLKYLKIRPSKFYVGSGSNLAFKSPTLEEYKLIKRRNPLYLDDGSEMPESLPNYWSN